VSDVTLEDYELFCGKTRDEIIGNPDWAGKEVDVRRTTWNKIMPRDQDELTFEQLTDYYDSPAVFAVRYARIISGGFFGQVERMLEADKQYALEKLRQVCRPGMSVLDYGCGTGKWGIYADSLGAEATLADIGTTGFRFISFLCKKYRPSIKLVELGENPAWLGNQFDFIICREVLEHVLDPIATLKYIIAHMKMGGEIYLSTFFNDMNGHDPSHLLRNNAHQDPEKWYGTVFSLGLSPSGYDDVGILKVFTKVEEQEWQSKILHGQNTE
jgi:SAM-dependent methyltransferase